MVSLDDKAFLLTYIRNCFVTGDDSGICELLCPRERITSEELEVILSGKGCVFPPENRGRISPEIPTNYEKVSRRQSAAESRFMQNKLEKEKKSKIKQTFLDLEPSKELTAEDVDDLFPIEDNQSESSDSAVLPQPKNKKSLLSHLLSETEGETNPFSDYAVYDGSSTGIGEENARSMQVYKVHLWHLPHDKRYVPVSVKPAWNTTVAQFIGLVAWKYTVEERDPPLKGMNLDDYDLFMFDDEDDLNSDFPPFSKNDHIYKYEFSTLVLLQLKKGVESRSAPTSESNDQIIVKIHLAQGSSSMLFPQDTKLRDVLAKIVHRRKLKDYDGGYAYRLENKNAPGASIDLNATLQEIGITEFCLARENSRQVITSSEEVNEPSGRQQMMAEILESLEVQHYKVNQKGVINREVLISVSGEKVEIEDVSKSTKLNVFKRKPLLYMMESIFQCRILTRSSGPRCVFKLVHGSRNDSPARNSASSIQFEAPRAVAESICRQVTNILYFRGANDSVTSGREKKGSISGTL